MSDDEGTGQTTKRLRETVWGVADKETIERIRAKLTLPAVPAFEDASENLKMQRRTFWLGFYAVCFISLFFLVGLVQGWFRDPIAYREVVACPICPPPPPPVRCPAGPP